MPAHPLDVLILQHPQEPGHELGSAKLLTENLPSATLRVGLSWPNLKKALGREATPSHWAVLYLGSGVRGAPPPSGSLTFVRKDGAAMDDSEARKIREELEGIVVLDGTWSQAKALWWRNAWLLKLKRAILTPARPSLYRELRREPRRECLSSIESVAEALDALGQDPALGAKLRASFEDFLHQTRSARTAPRPS